MKKFMAYSSEIYLLKIDDVLMLDKAEEYSTVSKEVVILLGNDEKNISDKLLSGYDFLKNAKQQKEKYIKVKIAYYSMPSILALFINLIKPIKRKYYVTGTGIYGSLLKDIEDKNLTRGVRNASNAYQWTGKWAISEEKRKERYTSLYNSIKEKGYDHNSPMLILLNRSLGVKDQLLQGHHRISICKEVGVEEISVKFWSSPKSPNFMRAINSFITTIKRIKK